MKYVIVSILVPGEQCCPFYCRVRPGDTLHTHSMDSSHYTLSITALDHIKIIMTSLFWHISAQRERVHSSAHSWMWRKRPSWTNSKSCLISKALLVSVKYKMIYGPQHSWWRAFPSCIILLNSIHEPFPIAFLAVCHISPLFIVLGERWIH